MHVVLSCNSALWHACTDRGIYSNIAYHNDSPAEGLDASPATRHGGGSKILGDRGYFIPLLTVGAPIDAHLQMEGTSAIRAFYVT